MPDTNMEKIRVLYVDDEKINLQAFRTTFKRDFEILLASSANEARQLLSNNKIDIIITDQRMPHETGIDFLSSIIKNYPDPIRILLTAYSDNQTVQDAVDSGLIYHYLTKPWEEKYFRNIVRNAFEAYTLRKRLKTLQKELLMVKQDLELAYRQNQIT
jgi:response regulator RpfG family c-di-GMP phosphodiesterase